MSQFPVPIHNSSTRRCEALLNVSLSSSFLSRGRDPIRLRDILRISHGAATPHILRPRADHFPLINDCFC
jgi:hypothetical protein